jgi:hypothetical protein
MMGAVPGRLVLVLALLWAPSARAAEGSIAVDVSEGCPGREQIVAALEARLPGVTYPGAYTRRLELERAPLELVLRLRDYGGGVLYLERRLSLDPRAPSHEACAALAEAVAQVVVRYLREIGYRPPQPNLIEVLPRVPTRSIELPERYGLSAGYLGVAAGVRAAGPSRGEAAVSFQLHRSGWRLGYVAELSAGATTETTAAVPGTPDAALRLRSFPLRLSLGLAFQLGPGALVPAVGAGAELLSFRASGLDDARSGLRVEPAVEGGLSYLWSGQSLFARAGALGGVILGAHDFDAGLTRPVFRTPGAYLRAQIEVGLVLWKNRRRLGL